MALLCPIAQFSAAQSGGTYTYSSGTFNISGSTNWSELDVDNSTQGIQAPTSTNKINVYNGASLTIDVSDAICGEIHLGVSNSGDGTLKFNGSSVLTLSNNTLYGSVYFGDGNSRGSLDMSLGGIMKISGNVIPNWSIGTFNPGSGVTGGTIIFNGAHQIIGGADIIFNNVELLNGAGTGTVFKSLSSTDASTLVVNGDLVIKNGVKAIPSFDHRTIAGGGTLKGDGTIVVNWTSTAASLSSQYVFSNKQLSELTVEFEQTEPQTIDALNYGNLIISGSRGSNNITFAPGTIGVSGTFEPNAFFTTGGYITTGNTVDFNGTRLQTIPRFNYNNLTSNNTGARTLPLSGNIGIAGIFTPGSNTYIVTGSTIEFNGSTSQNIPSFNYHNLILSNSGQKLYGGTVLGIAGNYTDNSTGGGVWYGSTFKFNGTTSQNVYAGAGCHNLIIDNPAGVSLLNGSSFLVFVSLSFLQGKINAGTGTVELYGNAVVTGASSNRFVNGKVFRLVFDPGSRLFPTGKTVNGVDYYRPVNVNYTTLTGSSRIIAELMENEFTGSFPSSYTQLGDHYWRITEDGSTARQYDINLDGTALFPEGEVKILKHIPPSENTLYSTTSSLSTYTATGLTTFGDFTLVEKKAVPPIITSFTPSNGTTGTTVTITGSNFNSTPSNNIVYFGAVRATFTAGTTTTLTGTAPPGTNYQPISVLDIETGLTGYASSPFITTFSNPFGYGIASDFYRPRIDFNPGSGPQAVIAGDADGDGKPDMLVVNYTSKTIAIYRNISTNGEVSAFTFASPVYFSTGTGSSNIIAFRDLDGDGRPELIISNQNENSVSVFRNTSSPGVINANSFAPKVDFAVGSSPGIIAVGDIDLDGKPEIISGNENSNNVSVLRNISSPNLIDAGSFAAKVDFSVGNAPYCVIVADLDMDSRPEIVTANITSNSLSVLANTATPGVINSNSFSAKVDFGTGRFPYFVNAGDLDDDGKPELVVSNYLANSISVFSNTSTPGLINSSSFVAGVEFATDIRPTSVAIGDADGDSKPDLATANEGSNNVSVLRNTAILGINNSSFSSKVDFATNGGQQYVTIADMNGDGRAEIASASGSSTVSIFQIKSATTVSLVSSANSSNIGQNINFTATVIAPFGNGTGGVEFFDGTTSIGSAILSANNATLSTSALLAGSHNITAVYSGDANYISSTSNLITQVVNAIPATALNFDSIDDNVYLGSSFTQQEFSLEMWLKPGATQQNYACIIDNNHTDFRSWMIQQRANNTNQYYFYFGNTSIGPSLDFTLTANTWQHLAIVKGDGFLSAYVNGVLVASTLNTQLISYDGSQLLHLGRWGGGGRNWNGSLDEVRIWNRALCEGEIQAYMNGELQAASHSGLLYYLKLNQGIIGANNAGISTAYNEIIANGNGTLNNFALNGAISNWVEGYVAGTAPVLVANPTFYQDADSDGFGNAAVFIQACLAPAGYVANSTDCNDANDEVYPGATETCNGTDDDCNGLVDDEADNEIPIIICPAPVTATSNQGCEATGIILGTPATSDNCGLVSVLSDHPSSTYSLGTTIVTWTATDVNGNTNSCTQAVTVVDNQAPSITCPGPVSINATEGECTGVATLTAPTVTDNCNSVGNALSFDGGYVDVPHNAILTPFDGWTIETWVKRTNSNMYECLIEKYSNGGYGYLLRIEGNYAITSFVTSSSSAHTITGTTPILPGAWYHLAGTFNRASGELKLYVNGVLDAQVSGLSNLLTSPATQSLKLGARGDDAAGRLSNGGLMDEVRIWNVARTQQQIQSSMNKSISAQEGLVASYQLNQGVAGGNNTGITTATDASGNSNTGNLVNFTLTGPTSNWVSGQSFGLNLTNNAPATYPIGNTTVTWTATDASGNTNTCSQIVTVADNQVPAITCPQPVTLSTTACTSTATTTLTAPIVTDNCNPIGNALSFDGGYVDVPHNALLGPLNTWTIETWVKRTNTDMQESLIEKYSNAAGAYGYLLRIQGNYAVASFTISSGFAHTATGTTFILPGVWYHLAATFNRANGTLKLYVNSVLDGELTGLTGLPTSPGLQSLKLGARGDDAATRLSNGGLMDEVRIWNVERTPAQIQAAMNRELSIQAGLVASYHLNQGIAGGNNTGLTSVTDASGNSNNGTLIEFALTGPTSSWVAGKVSGLTITNNAPAAYPVGNTTVTWTAIDASGNTSSCSQVVTVVKPPLLTASATGTSTACSNSATVNASGGTSPYTYLWSNGATTASITGLPAGTYSVVATDVNGCTASASVSVTASEAFNPSAQVTDVKCYGGSTGSMTITNVNATPPYQYSIDGVNFQGSNIFNNLVAGTYTVTVMDATGCSGFITKTINQPPILSIVLNNVQSTCYGLSTGTIGVTASGGSGAYSYSWTGPGGFTSTQKNLTNLASGNYALIVSDNNACTKNLNVVVPTFNQIIVSEVISNISCKGLANGAITLNVTGGTGSGFTFNWVGPGLTATTKNIANLVAGNYSITVTDIGSGCVATRNYIITQPATVVNLTTGKTNATDCSHLGIITVTGSGGTGPYQYKLNTGSYQSTATFLNLYGGNYTVWVRDAKGCEKSAAVAISDSRSDEYESNNSKTQAKAINVGATISARIALATDVADWFKFTTGSAGQYVVQLTHPTINYNFNMFSSVNNSPALSPVSTTPTSKQYILSANTIHYISITGGRSDTCYQFSVSVPTSFKSNDPVYTKITESVTDDVPKNLKVTAFPNPHKENFYLNIESPEDGTASIQLLATDGRSIVRKTVNLRKGKNNDILFNDIRESVLFYRVRMARWTAAGKIIGENQ